MVVDTKVQILPATTAALALAAALPGDPMAWAFEESELFDVDVQQFTGSAALVAPQRSGRLQVLQAAQPAALEDAADASRRDTRLGSNPRPRPARAAGVAGVKSDHADPLNLSSDSAQPISSWSSHRPRRRWPPPSESVLPPPRDAR